MPQKAVSYLHPFRARPTRAAPGRRLAPLALALALFPFATGARGAAAKTAVCVPAAHWMAPREKTVIPEAALIRTMAEKSVVLLGETHDNRDHHRWQLHTLAALYGVHPNMVIAFEAFPRRIQPVLDRWVRGELSESQFLKQSQWNTVWRFDPSLYMPLFQFARMHRVTMVAMNVDRALIHAIDRKGPDGVPAAKREGVGRPAPPMAQYRTELKSVFDQHEAARKDHHAGAAPPSGAPTKAGERPSPDAEKRFENFVAAQTTWDRAMAEAIAHARNGKGKDDKPLVVAIAGRGHLEYGYGIAYQLKALGVSDVATLIPWDPSRPCAALTHHKRAIGDAVFGLPAYPKDPSPKTPHLGVLIAPTGKSTKKGVHIEEIVPGSVAAAAGLRKGDIVIEAAGQKTPNVPQFIATIQRQAPGTWLPLKIRRAGETISIIAKFPRDDAATPPTTTPKR